MPDRDADPRPLPRGCTLEDLRELYASLPHLSQDDIDSFEWDIEEARSQLADPVFPQDPWER
jgi:hypothetical protein